MVLRLGMHEYDSFTEFLLKILFSLWLAGKEVQRILWNSFPMLVFTPASKGGLNQVIFLVLFLFFWLFLFVGLYVSLWLCPLFSSAAWYSGMLLLNISSLADRLDSL